MAWDETNSESGPPSVSTPSLSQTLSPTRIPTTDVTDVRAFRKSEDGKKLASWIQHEYSKAKSQRHTKFIEWVMNLSYFYGRQWLEQTSPLTPGGYDNRLFTPKKPPYARRLTVNRIRSFVRNEHSKFISERPSASVIPATAEDQDTMAAYAAEQVWESYSAEKRYETEFSKTAWWAILTGNGFLKTWWDDSIKTLDGQTGDICYGSVSPFNFYVPDIREEEIEGQPYVIHAYTKPIGWIRNAYKDELKGVQIQPSTTAANQIVDAVYLNLTSVRQPDSCIMYEAWFKPGAHKLLPKGGVVIQVDDTIISVYDQGIPYSHGQFPFGHLKHVPSGTFYADSPIIDLIQLQREYNQLRSDISEAGRRMGRPQLVAQKGAIIPGKMTNEPGAIIEYRPGTAAPQPIPLSPLPAYLIQQQETILNDWEDISGQHAASTGQAPPGVTAGTALSFLQEQDNNFLTPQFDSIEALTERTAKQTLQLFNQYVDIKRRVKVIGSDGAYDTQLLKGADIKHGLDIRIEKGSSLSQSKAAKQAQVTQMFSVGLISQDVALQLMEIGGPQKVIDYVSAAKRKAQRENTKMKLLTEQQVLQYNQMHQMAQSIGAGPLQDPFTGQMKGDPVSGDPTALPAEPMMGPPGMTGPGCVIPVDDFDEHAIHIQVHNTFRMGEEYESLPPWVKQQIDLHVKIHQQALQQSSMQSLLTSMPSDGSAPPLPGQGGVGSPQGAPSGPPPQQ